MTSHWQQVKGWTYKLLGSLILWPDTFFSSFKLHTLLFYSRPYQYQTKNFVGSKMNFYFISKLSNSEMKMCFTIDGSSYLIGSIVAFLVVYKIKSYLIIDKFTDLVKCCTSVFLLHHSFLFEGIFSWFFFLPGVFFVLLFITTPSLNFSVGRVLWSPGLV